MKKLLTIMIMLFVVIALTGCFEDRIYLDIMTDVDINTLTSAGPFSNISIRYSAYFHEWDVSAKIKISNTEIEIEVKEPTLKDAFFELQRKTHHLKNICEEEK